MSLAKYVASHAIRGECTCGRCIDAVANPESHQPTGHTVDLVFFKVASAGADKKEFETLARAEFPHWFDGQEHSYLETGADIGDQGMALVTMGLGALLGSWKLLTPRILHVPEELQKELAGRGLITIQVRPLTGTEHG